MIVCECYGHAGHNYDYLIIIGQNFLPPSLLRNTHQYNSLHGDKSKEPPKEWTVNSSAICYNPPTSAQNNPIEKNHSPVVS